MRQGCRSRLDHSSGLVNRDQPWLPRRRVAVLRTPSKRTKYAARHEAEGTMAGTHPVHLDPGMTTRGSGTISGIDVRTRRHDETRTPLFRCRDAPKRRTPPPPAMSRGVRRPQGMRLPGSANTSDGAVTGRPEVVHGGTTPVNLGHKHPYWTPLLGSLTPVSHPHCRVLMQSSRRVPA